MNIREWFDFNGNHMPSTNVNNSVDDLLRMYSSALIRYFSVDEAKNFHAIQNLDTKKLNLDQVLFLEWLNEKGFPYLTELASTDFKNDADLDAKIQYDMYILQEEMDFEYPDDVKSSLISIVNDFPGYVAATTESGFEFEDFFKITIGNNVYTESYSLAFENAAQYMAATVFDDSLHKEVKSSIYEKNEFYMSESYNSILAKSQYKYIIEEIDKILSNTKKSDENQAFLFCFGGD